MAFKLLINLNFFFVAFLAGAQTADFYFHNGSKHYVFGESEKAKAAIGTGLEKFPQDPQLNSLAGLIKKEEKQQTPKSGDQNQEQEKDKEKKSKSQSEQKDSEKKDENSEQQSKEDQQKKDEQKQKGESGKDEKSPEQQEQEQQEAMAMAAGKMTQEQARQFLDMQKQEDKALIFSPPKKPLQPNQRLKDW